MIWPVSRERYRHCLRVSVLVFLLLLGTSTTGLPGAQAVSYDLTGDGLGLVEGNYGKKLEVSPALELRGLVYGNRTGWPSGCSGTIYVDQKEGVGVQTSSWRRPGYTRINGYFRGAYESLVLNFDKKAVSAASIKLYLNRIHHHYDSHGTVWIDIAVKPATGPIVMIPNVLDYFHPTGGDPDPYHSDPNHDTNGTLSGYFSFSEIPEMAGVGSLKRITVRAGRYAHFYVSGIDYQPYGDTDNDGYPADDDCDDHDGDVNPGATEVCNGIDDDCDGLTDETCTIYYRDADNDGFGDPNATMTHTSPPAGYVATAGDCDDTDAGVYPGATEVCDGDDEDCDGQTDEGCTLWYWDADGDTYGDANDASTYEHDGYTTQNAGDCDDTTANINPGAFEQCNGADDNCDGTIDEGCVIYYWDGDGDTYGDGADFVVATSPPAGYVRNDGDCDDTDANINPAATEVCNDEDDNCAGGVDEGCTLYYRDFDEDSFGDPNESVEDMTVPEGYVANDDDCDDYDENEYPGADEQCDGDDDDCDGNMDEGCPTLYPDADEDGYGNPGGATTTVPQAGYVANDDDCNDGDGSINPGATEICNGEDDNCDGDTDEGCATYYRDADGDTFGDPANAATDTSQPSGYVANAGDCDDTDASRYPGAVEVCDGDDENCDGNIDEGCATYYRDADGDGFGAVGDSTTDTSPPVGYVANAGDCNDADADINPAATETCDGVDENCDDTVDEGCATYYGDADGDGYGDPSNLTTDTQQPAGYVGNAGDCDDTDANVNPGATEICNGVDDNCDGNDDEGCATYYQDADGDTYGNLAVSQVATSQPAGYVTDSSDCDDANGAINPGATETCNGVDDNCDGNIDEGCVTYYWDWDGDGFGNPNVAQELTSPPGGNWVTASGDCNDDPETGGETIYPGASELCDGKDNDCDTQTDEGCATYYRDADGDTYGDVGDSTVATSQPAGYVTDSSDCNDGDANIYPGAAEMCNGVDDDCDTLTDEGCVTYYQDSDSDGFGNPAVSQVATSPPAGYVTDSSDCNDTNGEVYPGATELCNGIDDDCDMLTDEGCVTYYQDSDSDGFGNAAVSQEATSQPAGYLPTPGDCDDSDNTVYPGASELCDGKDNDCDTQVDEGCTLLYWDGDSDGWGNPAGPTTTVPQSGYVPNAGDCDDGNAGINPGATEVCNGIDDNCDGNADEGCATYYQDSDSDGFGNAAVSQVATSPPAGHVTDSSDCNDNNADIYPGATEICNGVDDDCDTLTDEGCVTYYQDSDSDGFGNPAVSQVATSPPAGYVTDSSDCNDTNGDIHPGATELCNGVDDDCDTLTDEGCATYYQDSDSDGFGNSAVSQVATSPPAGYVTDSSDCDDTNGNVYPGAAEKCNGIDDDCDTLTDEGCVTYYQDSDGDTYGNAGVSQVATTQPAGYVAASGDCDDANADINPGATEVCNSVDDNCDGNIDEGCVTYYQDSDNDSFGNPAVSQEATSQPAGYVAASGDCNDNDNTVYPGATELCDGKDNDCDTQIDEGCTLLYRDGDSDGWGDPAGPTTTIPQSGYVANAGDCDDANADINPGATEICNGVDDNCDGTTDEGCATYYRDTDGDAFGDQGDSTTATSQPAGYVTNGGDCNDGDADINPSATEICNGVDDNCDGKTDEGCITYYRDADGDAYGDPGNATTATSQPAGYVANAGDCNDGDADINPSATEICNGVDDNCDITVDEGCATYYRDVDEDGFGAPGDSVVADAPPFGYVANDDDCDDTDDDIYPGATEQCTGIDNDCDGSIDEGCVTYFEDADGDTFGNSSVSQTVNSPAPPPGYVGNDGDCDDADSNVYPGAVEVEDGIDNDCDGKVDIGICADDCSFCDLNYDGVCDEQDLAVFSHTWGWEEYDCDTQGDIECDCDLVAPNRTCDGLDGICFQNAYESPECRAAVYIEKLRRRRSEPGDKLRIIGKGFGDGLSGGQVSVVHIGPKEFEYGHRKIKRWSPTRIKIKIPKRKFTKNDCAWFKGRDFRRVKVWVTVGGEDSNVLKLKLLKPATCP